MTVTATYTRQKLAPEQPYTFLPKKEYKQPSSTTKSNLDKPPQNKTIESTPLSADIVRAFLEVFPQRQQVNELVTSRCREIHKDERINDLSNLFVEIIALNNEQFFSKTDTEKAKILYQFHTDQIIQPIVKNNLPLILQSFLERIRPENRTPETKNSASAELIKSMYIHFNQYGSSYPAIAIQKALKLESTEVLKFRHQNTSVGIKLKEPLKISFYKQ